MNRNQKIAIGCGGAGCLGLLVVAVAGVAFYFWYDRRPTMTNRNANISINTNRDPNTNSSNSNSSNSSDETPTSSMSDDDKHKLFQAAGMTQDSELVLRVLRKIGFGSGIGSDYEEFVRDHAPWAVNNYAFITSVSTPEKARAYVEEHLDD
jgi:hypothetical protein